jgi:hypothetical protein
MEQVAGPRPGVALAVDKVGPDEFSESDGFATFPLRKGDRRVISFYAQGGGYKSFGVRLHGVVSETWLDPEPLIITFE